MIPSLLARDDSAGVAFRMLLGALLVGVLSLSLCSIAGSAPASEQRQLQPGTQTPTTVR